MITNKILYQNAYNNIYAYYSNIGYWKKCIQLTIEDSHNTGYSYLTSHDIQNLEGSPICRYLNKRKHKGIYIYQYSTYEDYSQFPYNRYFTAWINKDSNHILVIYLLCTKENVKHALHLINLWINDEDTALKKEIENIYNNHESILRYFFTNSFILLQLSAAKLYFSIGSSVL